MSRSVRRWNGATFPNGARSSDVGGIIPPDYPTLFFFEVGEWWDYAMLVVVIAGLAFTAWLAQRNMWAILAVFIVIPVALTFFWWRG